MTRPEQEHPQNEYWNVDEAIGEVTLWRDQRYTLRMRAHLVDELYRQSPHEEIIPLAHSRGVRTYVHAKPYVLVPDITLGVSLYPTADDAGAIGEVTSSTWGGMRHEEVGNAQAWFYVEDRTIVLWEAFVFDRYRTPDLGQDTNTHVLWDGFEGFLTARFSSARQLVTTYDDPVYDTDQYQAFLRDRGYSRLSPAAFVKQLPERGRV